MSAPLRGGIIAAGDGLRLRAAGYAMPKPLVPVAGEPLIARVIDNFVAAGIRALTVIVNEDGRACRDVLAVRFPDLDCRCIVKTTRSSLESFFEVAGDPAPGRML
ncbi:MAG: NTP transferase domain-containing protein, partial [Candidatus Rokubacteria bacterium]|nr:NTP transferase domain-containing protein [Candidatus Rokubacteria bacterium]